MNQTPSPPLKPKTKPPLTPKYGLTAKQLAQINQVRSTPPPQTVDEKH